MKIHRKEHRTSTSRRIAIAKGESLYIETGFGVVEVRQGIDGETVVDVRAYPNVPRQVVVSEITYNDGVHRQFILRTAPLGAAIPSSS